MPKTYDVDLVQAHARELRRTMVGIRFRHYKGNTYVVTDVTVDEEVGEPRVSYISDSKDHRWSRLYSVWTKVMATPEGRIPRFEALSNYINRTKGDENV